jgi:hypothetical protein
VTLHSVLRPIPICGTSFLGSYGAHTLTSRHWNPTSKWSVEGCYLYLVLRRLTLGWQHQMEHQARLTRIQEIKEELEKLIPGKR